MSAAPGATSVDRLLARAARPAVRQRRARFAAEAEPLARPATAPGSAVDGVAPALAGEHERDRPNEREGAIDTAGPTPRRVDRPSQAGGSGEPRRPADRRPAPPAASATSDRPRRAEVDAPLASPKLRRTRVAPTEAPLVERSRTRPPVPAGAPAERSVPAVAPPPTDSSSPGGEARSRTKAPPPEVSPRTPAAGLELAPSRKPSTPEQASPADALALEPAAVAVEPAAVALEPAGAPLAAVGVADPPASAAAALDVVRPPSAAATRLTADRPDAPVGAREGAATAAAPPSGPPAAPQVYIDQIEIVTPPAAPPPSDPLASLAPRRRGASLHARETRE